MKKSGTQGKTGSKVSEKPEKTPKKNAVKNTVKTRQPNKKNKTSFSSDNQPDKRGNGRPAGLKDFATYLHEVSDGEGRKELVKQVWQGIKEGRSDMIKLAMEYLFEKPKQTVENINHEPLQINVTTAEQAQIIKDGIK